MATIDDLVTGFLSLTPDEQLRLVSLRRGSRAVPKLNKIVEKKKASKKINDVKNLVRGLGAEGKAELKKLLKEKKNG